MSSPPKLSPPSYSSAVGSDPSNGLSVGVPAVGLDRPPPAARAIRPRLATLVQVCFSSDDRFYSLDSSYGYCCFSLEFFSVSLTGILISILRNSEIILLLLVSLRLMSFLHILLKSFDLNLFTYIVY